MEPEFTEVSRFLDDHAVWVLRLATVLTSTPQDAEDLAQEALMRAIRHLGRVQRSTSPRAYLRRIVMNESMRRPRLRVELVDTLMDPGEFEAGYAGLEARQETSRLLTALPQRQAAAVALRYLEDCEYREIAVALRCREATARSLVKRGMDQLRRDAHAQQCIDLER